MGRPRKFNEAEKYYILNSPDSDQKKAENLGRTVKAIENFIAQNVKVTIPSGPIPQIVPVPPQPKPMPSADLMGKRKVGESTITVMTQAASEAFDEARPELMKKSDKLTRNVYKIK